MMKTRTLVLRSALLCGGLACAASGSEDAADAGTELVKKDGGLKDSGDGAVVPQLNDTVVTQRPANFPGFVPSQQALRFDAESTYLTPLPELDSPPLKPEGTPGVFVIKPSLGGWNAVPLDDPNVWLFLATPGDYTAWGVIPLEGAGTPARRKVIRYYDPDRWKYDAPNAYRIDLAGRSANFEGIAQKEDAPKAAYWTIHKLTFKGHGWIKDGHQGGMGINLRKAGGNNRVDQCFFWKWAGGKFSGDRNVFQRNVVKGSLGAKGDQGAIAISTSAEAGSYDGRIVANELSDGSDLLGLPKDGDGAETFGFVDGTIIADNDLYWSEDSRRYADGGVFNCGGNAIDIKNGSLDPARPVLITGNRIRWDWPTPPDESCGDNTGSNGTAILTHKDVRHVLIMNNIVMDSSIGASSYPGEVRDMKSYNIAYVNNLFYRLTAQIPGATGYVWKLTAPDIDVMYNTSQEASWWVSVSKEGKDVLNIFGNRAVGVQTGIPVSDHLMQVGDNYFGATPDVPLGDMEILFPRLSEPQKILLKTVVLHKQDVPAALAAYPTSQTTSVIRTRWFRDLLP